MYCLSRMLGLLVKNRRHSKRLTGRAVEAVAIIAWPALAGKWSLGVIAHGLLMAPAWLALIYVFRQERRGWVRTERNQPSTVPICGVLLWSGISTMIWVSLWPKLSSECSTSSKGRERTETMNERSWGPAKKTPKNYTPTQDLHTWNAHLLFMFHSSIFADVLCKQSHLLQPWADGFTIIAFKSRQWIWNLDYLC